MPARFEVELLERCLCGAEILTCRFSRPAEYAFRAGQWFRLFLHTPDDEIAETFSHCSAPFDDEIVMTTRLSGSVFKNVLDGLEVGDRVEISASGGRLSLPEGAQRLCFLAGGVGITPVRSLLRAATHEGRAFDDAVLIYGNRDESCAPFAEEFKAMQSAGVRLVLCYERPSDDWTGERGFITAETVRRHLEPVEGCGFLIAGPPVMVEAMERVLDELGVPGEARTVEHFGAALRPAG
ncbi:MAG: FAD-dependent oxidoreductase [Coriobacteriia bacterium]|nr:FAD-dependent oxidoreductase [Coriobacteriia bacterium]